LKAQGYIVNVSPPGPDKSVDIVAGRGGLGFEPPRLVVQVKSGNFTADQQTLQALIGAVQDTSADQGRPPRILGRFQKDCRTAAE
jgi:restriction system protein